MPLTIPQQLKILYTTLGNGELSPKELKEAFETTLVLILKLQQENDKRIKGEKGDKGEQGEKGERGEQGKQGIGVKGEKGEKGDAGRDGVDGKDGYTPIKGKDYFDGDTSDPKEIAELVELPPEKTTDEIIKTINEPTEAKIKKERVEGISELEERLSNIPRGKGLGMRKVPIVRSIDLSAQCNGQTRVFNGLPKDTVRIVLGTSSQFPFILNSNDVTLDGTQITLDNSVPALEAGQTFMLIIETLFYA